MTTQWSSLAQSTLKRTRKSLAFLLLTDPTVERRGVPFRDDRKIPASIENSIWRVTSPQQQAQTTKFTTYALEREETSGLGKESISDARSPG